MINLLGATDKGLVRETNQDSFTYTVVSENLAFAVLCDGMGGENGGGVASDLAMRLVADMLRRDLHEGVSESTIHGVMQSAVAGANAMVYDAAGKDPQLKGMGTTLIVAVFLGNRLFIRYVGDSRVYVATQKEEAQLTRDHTVVQMLLDMGQITEQEAPSHPKRHYITRAVGVGAEVDADFVEHTFTEDSLVLLCSDGLYNYLEPGTLYGLLQGCIQAGTVDQLIELAKTHGGSDNITAVLAAYTGKTGEGA